MKDKKAPRPYRAMRRLSDIEAEVLSETGIAAVSIRDISRDGARVVPGHWMARGSAVTLKVAGEDLSAIVHWSRGDAAGLRFIERPDPKTLIKVEGSTFPGAR